MSDNGFEIWWDDEMGIVRGRVIGNVNEEVANGILQTTQKMAEKHGEELKWLIDLSQMTKATSRGRKILVESANFSGSLKHAFIGGSTFVRTVINFIISATGRDNSSFFSNEDDAILWLLGENGS